VPLEFLESQRFRFSLGPLFRRLLKTQPGASAWIALACGAGVSIKPGRKPQERVKKKIPSPRKRAADDRFCMSGNREFKLTALAVARYRGLGFCLHAPGARAQGFMLSPASQADLPSRLRSLC